MGIAKKGVNGQVIGKVGESVGYMLNGQHVIRSIPNYVKRKPSRLTLINRERMKATSVFLHPIKEIIVFGYKDISPKGSRVGPFQAAQSQVFKEAIAFHEDGMPFVDPAKVLVFRGDLTPPQQLSVSRTGNVLNFTWEKVGQSILIIVAYSEDPIRIKITEPGAPSEAGCFSWEINIDEPVHIYAAFHRLLGSKLSNSVYGGKV